MGTHSSIIGGGPLVCLHTPSPHPDVAQNGSTVGKSTRTSPWSTVLSAVKWRPWGSSCKLDQQNQKRIHHAKVYLLSPSYSIGGLIDKIKCCSQMSGRRWVELLLSGAQEWGEHQDIQKGVDKKTLTSQVGQHHAAEGKHRVVITSPVMDNTTKGWNPYRVTRYNNGDNGRVLHSPT
ncbi:hypothetical protein B0H17DRAFT_1138646 [Mycena rosella]|uniref:Uncharacterized protein n=1 Tax=Mycena rosella TaxID=1033263 RepID=A0AAD7D6I7_MYCRO|nr:hypothetical protein B0H17DRAFT_1138646 [Mycena rosella]